MSHFEEYRLVTFELQRKAYYPVQCIIILWDKAPDSGPNKEFWKIFYCLVNFEIRHSYLGRLFIYAQILIILFPLLCLKYRVEVSKLSIPWLYVTSWVAHRRRQQLRLCFSADREQRLFGRL